MIRLAFFLLSAVCAAIVFAMSFDLPKPRPIATDKTMTIEVVAPREPVLATGTIMGVGELTTGYVHRPHSAPLDPSDDYAAPAPSVDAQEPPVRVYRPDANHDPLYYHRYVQETVRGPHVYYSGEERKSRALNESRDRMKLHREESYE